MDLILKIEKLLRESGGLIYGGPVIAGVSGGPDSTALLHILNALRNKLGIKLHAAHLNHQLRPSANRDEHAVKELCRRLNIPCTVKRARILTSPGKSSLEEAAREKRFEFLLTVARQKKAGVIALGHTQDDLAETVLMRILRGAGLLGLQGILPVKQRQGVQIIRPLIFFSKKEILAYLRKNRIKFCLDPTNKSAKFFRNKVRLQLLPLLEKEYQPNIREILINLANSTAVDYDYLQREAAGQLQKIARFDKNKKQIGLRLSGLRPLHPALQRMVIRLAVQDLKGNLNQFSLKHMNEIEGLIHQRPDRSCVDLPHQITVQKNKNFLNIAARNA